MTTDALPPGALPAHQLGDTTHRDRAAAGELIADRDRHRDQLRSLCWQLAVLLGDVDPGDHPAWHTLDEPDVLADRVAEALTAAQKSADAATAEVARLREACEAFLDVRRELGVSAGFRDDGVAPLVAGLVSVATTRARHVQQLRAALQHLVDADVTAFPGAAAAARDVLEATR